MDVFIPLLVALPLAASFATVLLAQFAATRRLVMPLAVLVVAATLALSLALIGSPRTLLYVGGWGPETTLGIEIVPDGLAVLLLLTVNFVALVSLVFAVAYMRRFTSLWLFCALFLLMTGSMNAVVLAGDLFNAYVFLEVAVIASYALVAFGCGTEELEAAFKYLVLGAVGSAFILVGVTILYALSGHLNMARVHQALTALEPGPATFLAAAMLLAGISLKAAMVPFHAWLPDAHPSAPAPISAMLSGVLIKACGVYLLARVVFNVLGPQAEYAMILIVLGLASMVIGVFLAVGQWDFKRLLAYHSISQMGYVVLAFGVAADIASPGGSRDLAVAGLCLLGGLFHMFNHAAFKSLLFLSSGAIEQQAGTRELKLMGGLARQMPFTGFCCRVGALSIAGVPPFNGFFSKLIIIIALVLAGRPVLAVIATLVALLTLLSFVKVQRYALEGEASPTRAAACEAPWPMGAAMGALAIVCLVAGLALVPLQEFLFEPAGEALLGTPAQTLAKGVAP